MNTTKMILSMLLCVLTLHACKQNDVRPTYPYAIRMTDAPGPYDAVYIDIQGVEITGNDGKAVMTNVNTGIYNLLALSNGLDTLIATGALEVATVSQIRLILGPNNSVVVSNVNYPLSTPSAEQSGLKLQVHHTLQAGVQYNVLLDFDANQSIVQTGNGTYKLKPVIRTIETAISGAIKGQISPAGTSAFVTANGTSSYSSGVNADGKFILAGLPTGIYSITIIPAFPFSPVTLNTVTVSNGITTNIGVIAL